MVMLGVLSLGCFGFVLSELRRDPRAYTRPQTRVIGLTALAIGGFFCGLGFYH